MRDHVPPFNRTSLESKLRTGLDSAVAMQTFNRTSLESKLNTECASQGMAQAFNRTSLESKQTTILPVSAPVNF